MYVNLHLFIHIIEVSNRYGQPVLTGFGSMGMGEQYNGDTYNLR
jgi:hypothetical protein